MALQFLPSSIILLALTTLSCFRLLPLRNEAPSRLYIVYMGEKKHDDPNVVTASHHAVLTVLLGSKEKALSSIVYNYKHGFSGFAAMLTESQANRIAELPDVVSVRPSGVYKLHTTRSWDYLGLNYDQTNGLLHDSNMGDDVIIGVIDTGIWPESQSFNDTGFEPVPSRWKGTCQVGDAFDANNCNRKIIGARWYANGVDPEILKGEYLSPRDKNGHGTHTASTAAGVLVGNVSVHGLAAGAARGGAPRARLAIYKACWGPGSCYEAGILKAMDDAVHDGVDILSLSIGGDGYPDGSLAAVARGITVVFSGGNDGPYPQTVANALPWVVTVAASTIDRAFPTVVTLGNGQQFVGQSLFYENQKNDSFKPLVYAGSCSADALSRTPVAGSVVLCYAPNAVTSTIPRADLLRAISNVFRAKGSGVIYAQYTTNLLFALEQCDGRPCVLVDFETANRIVRYWIAASTPVAKVRPTEDAIGPTVLAPKVGAFSSRGPSVQFPDLLKPDVAAPGVTILAAVGNSYHFETGTSMSCPHIAGIAALLKSLHPSWSPAAIKSALVTTASVADERGMPLYAEGHPRKLADPLDFGGGHVNPNRAADPGLIFDIDPNAYLDYFNCTIGMPDACDSIQPLYNLNLPSISIPNLKANVIVKRTVSNVGSVNAVYEPLLQPPPGTKMVVKPPMLQFSKNHQTRHFTVSLTPKNAVQGDWTFGSLIWKDGANHAVRIQIAARLVIQDSYADTS